MKKIGLLTWHYYNNFGSSLQAYALQSYLESSGFDVRVINYRNPRKAEPEYRIVLKRILGRICHCLKISMTNSLEFALFHKDYLHETKRLKSKNEVQEISRRFDYLVCGSDQIWAPNVLNPIYLLNFDTPAKKIAYAASVGLTRIPDELVDEYKTNLSDFYKITVREETGRKILAQQLELEAVTVLDPTLLLSTSQYDRILTEPEEPKKYCFVYLLNKAHSYRDRIETFAKENNLAIVGVSSNKADYSWIKRAKGCGPREFIGYMKRAEYVFTDSYHGTIFSLLYHKKFATFERFQRNDPINQNSRIEQLGECFGISNLILGLDDSIPSSFSYDYTAFEKKLSAERERVKRMWEALG